MDRTSWTGKLKARFSRGDLDSSVADDRSLLPATPERLSVPPQGYNSAKLRSATTSRHSLDPGLSSRRSPVGRVSSRDSSLHRRPVSTGFQESPTAPKQHGEAKDAGMSPSSGKKNSARQSTIKMAQSEDDASISRSIGITGLPIDRPGGRMAVTFDESVLPLDERYPGPMPWHKLVGWNDACENWDTASRQKEGQIPEDGLCRRCRRFCLVEDDQFTDNKAIQFRPFGTWYQLLLRSRCRICRLIVVSLSCNTEQLHPKLAAIDPMVQFVQLFPKSLPTGETILKVEYGMRKVGILRMITHRNYSEVLRQAWEAPFYLPWDSLVKDDSFYHRKDGQLVSFQLLEQWIADCEKNHSQACRVVGQGPKGRGDSLIFLIHVEKRCLVKRSMNDTRYFALSYVCGQSSVPRTTKENLSKRLDDLSLPRMPKTIEDAMVLTQRLGEFYLWVDALCIVQDDFDGKLVDMARMDAVFMHAVATIVALSGTNVESGLPGVRPGTRPPQPVEVPQILERKATPSLETIRQLDELASNNSQLYRNLLYPASHGTTPVEFSKFTEHLVNRGPRADLRSKQSISSGRPSWPFMVAHPPSLKHILAISPWNTRAWTLQERLLSRRCIYFTSDYVYFQCAENTLCETGGNLLTWSDLPSTNSNKLHVGRSHETNPLLNFQMPSLSDTASRFHVTPHGSTVRHDFDVYSEVISMYSARNLSSTSDALHALHGILNVIHDRIGGRILAGLPSRYLDMALLWTPAEPFDRITPLGRQDNAFPSWSWAAWTGSKQHLITEYPRFSPSPLEQEFAQSEVDNFTILYNGEHISVFKDANNMRAMHVRPLGHRSGNNEAVYSKYVSYSENITPRHSSPIRQPNLLQFWTYAVNGDYFSVANDLQPRITDPEHGNIPGRQALGRLLDPNEKHCGFLFEPRSKTPYRKGVSRPLEYILISSFPEMTEKFPGIPTMNSAKPFDDRAFPWRGEGSGMVNLMLVERFDSFVERISVAQIHRQAWEAAKPVQRQILLA